MKAAGPDFRFREPLVRRRASGPEGGEFMAVNRYERQTGINLAPVVIEAGGNTVPYAGRGESYRLGLTPYQDHGRPAFFGSTIKSSRGATEAAKHLRPEEAERLNKAIGTQLERLLEGRPLDSAAVLSSSVEGKPDVSIIIVGDPWSERSLRLYCHHGKRINDAVVLWVDGRTTRRDSDKIERDLRQDGGYTAPKGWNSRKRS
ncbi:MAG: hypothetical protein COU25_02065 [Candidatus Levybacteria bacterium CG10_big_fil_rev_8_21_14_0_10_35_13]|nr:MAG: hypothetical protein COU25_02065 [Candidatus Levybacteria bacterium CG10_big_fil_rev_8_21_14_0_10_35_13]